jgi:hypothetical protein
MTVDVLFSHQVSRNNCARPGTLFDTRHICVCINKYQLSDIERRRDVVFIYRCFIVIVLLSFGKHLYLENWLIDWSNAITSPDNATGCDRCWSSDPAFKVAPPIIPESPTGGMRFPNNDSSTFTTSQNERGMHRFNEDPTPMTSNTRQIGFLSLASALEHIINKIYWRLVFRLVTASLDRSWSRRQTQKLCNKIATLVDSPPRADLTPIRTCKPPPTTWPTDKTSKLVICVSVSAGNLVRRDNKRSGRTVEHQNEAKKRSRPSRIAVSVKRTDDVMTPDGGRLLGSARVRRNFASLPPSPPTFVLHDAQHDTKNVNTRHNETRAIYSMQRFDFYVSPSDFCVGEPRNLTNLTFR